MPEPRSGEKVREFMPRCVEYLMKEGTAKDNKQATAICYSLFRKHAKKGKKIAASFGEEIVIVPGQQGEWKCSDAETATYRKQVIRVGHFEKGDQSFDITPELIEHWNTVCNEMLDDGIRIPITGADHVVNEATSYGFVKAFEIEGDSLYAVMDISAENPDVLTRNNDISIYSIPSFKGGNGVVYLRPITSLAITPVPVIPGLDNFEKIAASFGDNEIRFSAVIDDVTCEICRQHNGHEYTMNQIMEQFPDADADGPHVHPNCRCSWGVISASQETSIPEPVNSPAPVNKVIVDMDINTIANCLKMSLEGVEKPEEAITTKLSQLMKLSEEMETAKLEFDKRILASEEECNKKIAASHAESEAKLKQASEAMALSQKASTPDERLVSSVRDNMVLRVDGLVRDGNISRAAGERIKSRLDNGTISLSLVNSSDKTISDLLQILACSRPVTLGEKSQGQVLENPAGAEPAPKTVRNVADAYYNK